MKPTVLALDLEGTLISNAISQIPRPGLHRFLLEVQSQFNQLVMFTTVPEDRFRVIAELLGREGSAPTWFASLNYVQWAGKTKDLRLVAPRLGKALLLDDHGPYVHPGQEHLWVQIPLFASPYPPSDDGLLIASRRLVERVNAAIAPPRSPLEKRRPLMREPMAIPLGGGAQSLTPVPQILRSAAVEREALAAQWLSAGEVAAGLGLPVSTGSCRVGQLRRTGCLLGVYIANPVSSYRYPTWQFDANGQPADHLAEILMTLRGDSRFACEPDGLRRTTGWGEVEWLLSPHALLDGAAPSELLVSDSASVLKAARAEFLADG